LNALEIAIEKIKETILKLGGHFAIQMAVRKQFLKKFKYNIIIFYFLAKSCYGN
jgi:hypothetical protein